jgi:hypothetical protein
MLIAKANRDAAAIKDDRSEALSYFKSLEINE